MLNKLEKLSKVLNESYSEKSLLSSLGTFFKNFFGVSNFSINTEDKTVSANKYQYPLYKHKKLIGFLEFDNKTNELEEFFKYCSTVYFVKNSKYYNE